MTETHTNMGLTTILIAIIIVLALVVIHYRRTAGQDGGGGDGSSTTWSAVKDSWAQLRGGVLNMVIGGSAGKSSTEWVTKNSPHGKGGSMAKSDADTVCGKACDGWADNPSVAAFCNCETETALDF